MVRLGSLIIAVALSTPAGNICSAEPILFLHEGVGSGSIGGVPFTDAEFVIRAQADTESRRIIPGIGFTTSHDSTLITIDGVGTYEFTTPTRTFINRTIGLVGFARVDDLGYDLFQSATDDSLVAWNMLYEVGPISGTGKLLQWGRSPSVGTDGGTLIFDDATPEATFTAIIPAPGSIGLAVALGGIALRRRR